MLPDFFFFPKCLVSSMLLVGYSVVQTSVYHNMFKFCVSHLVAVIKELNLFVGVIACSVFVINFVFSSVYLLQCWRGKIVCVCWILLPSAQKSKFASSFFSGVLR